MVQRPLGILLIQSLVQLIVYGYERVIVLSGHLPEILNEVRNVSLSIALLSVYAMSLIWFGMLVRKQFPIVNFMYSVIGSKDPIKS